MSYVDVARFKTVRYLVNAEQALWGPRGIETEALS